jgi:NTE family protein
MSFNKYHSFNPKTVLLFNLQSGININSQNFVFDNFKIGGMQKVTTNQMVFAGLNDTQINSSSLSSVMVGLQYNFTGSFMVIGRANTGIYDFATQDKIFDTEKVEWINGFSLGMAYNLGVLPMEYNVMYSPEIGAFYNHVKIGFLF